MTSLPYTGAALIDQLINRNVVDRFAALEAGRWHDSGRLFSCECTAVQDGQMVCSLAVTLLVCALQTITHAAALLTFALSCRQMFAKVAEWEKAGSNSLGIAETQAAQRIVSA